jgi:hypothetical protein
MNVGRHVTMQHVAEVAEWAETWSQNSAGEQLLAQDVGVPAVMGQLAQDL